MTGPNNNLVVLALLAESFRDVAREFEATADALPRGLLARLPSGRLLRCAGPLLAAVANVERELTRLQLIVPEAGGDTRAHD